MNSQFAPGFYNVRDFGAAGDGATPDTRALQAAIDACAKAGGGTVCVPAGAYVTGAIALRSHISLFLDAGATVLGSHDPADYPVISSRWEGVDRETHAPLIGGNGLENIAVLGRGIVDGRGAPWWKGHRERTLAHPRPRLISFDRCRNVLIQGVTLTRSPSWTVHPLRCENVRVDGVTIVNPPDSPNTDGINPDSCRDVRITNCHIDVGDDCIAIKSGVEAGGRANLSPCEHILIANCTMVHGHGGVVIGSEMSGSVRRVVVSNCIFNETDRGIRIKSRRGRGGVVEDVRVTNVIMHEVLCPFSLNLYYHIGVKGDRDVADRRPRPVTEGTPRVRRIHLSHITVRGAHYAAAYMSGLPEMPAEEITFDDVSISMRPDAQAGPPDMADDVEPVRQAGLLLYNLRGLRLHNVAIGDHAGPALRLVDAADVDIRALAARPPAQNAPVILMENVEGALVQGCVAAAGTGAFLCVEGDRSSEIALVGNRLTRARRPVQLGAEVRPDAVVE